MSYEPKEWVSGEVITADKLNNIEEGIQNALESDCGYECTESQVTVFEDSLTTTSMGSFNGVTFTPTEPIEGNSITVSFNGTEYELPKVTVPFGDGYGDFDASSNPVFTNYPCAIGISNGQHYFFTQSGGTYQVAIYGMALTVETTEYFEKAVIKVMGKPLNYVKDSPISFGGVVENDVDTNQASGAYSHAEGGLTIAGGDHSHAEGTFTRANGGSSHAEGNHTEAIGASSHAEGFYATTTDAYSHAEGYGTKANGESSHAEGQSTEASGANSHAEGTFAEASGANSHAEGDHTEASGANSHAQNEYTKAQGKDQTAIGKFNIAQGNASSSSATDYAFIIGNGTADNARSNAFAIKWNGTFVFANGTEITPAQFASLLALLQ